MKRYILPALVGWLLAILIAPRDVLGMFRGRSA